MSSSSSSQVVHVSPVYRLVLLYVEPFMAFYGAVMAARSPLLYLAVMAPAADRSLYRPELQVVLDQLAGCYLLFAFNQAVVLRVADGHLRVWRALLAGMLLCDLAHVAATARAMPGGWPDMLDPSGWRPYDWVNVATLYGVAAMRLAFLAGVGVREEEVRSKTKTG